MSTNYPGAIDDNTTLPSATASTDTTEAVPHNENHNNANDAIKALEAKLGDGVSLPNNAGLYLGSDGSGGSLWKILDNIPQSSVVGLVAALAGKQSSGNYITALTGDVTASGPGSAVATVPGLATRLLKSTNVIQVGASAPSPYTTDGTNDEVQISAAYTALNAAGGGIIDLIDASYHVGANPIQIKSSVWIRGLGMNKTTIYGDSTLGTNAVMLAGGTSIGSPSTDCEFSDFTIDGSSMPTAPLSTFRKGIDAIYTLRWRLTNVRVYATPATGYGPDCNVGLRMDNCIADTCGRSASNPGYNGFGIGTGYYQYESVQMVNCVAINCLNNGFLFEYVGGVYNSKNYQLTNCYALGNSRGYRISGTSGVVFNNCVAGNSTNEGIYVQLFGANNNNPVGTKVLGCEVFGNGADGIYFKDQEYGQFNTICEDNIVYNNAGYGILTGGSFGQVRKNTVYGNGKTGILYHAFSLATVYDAQVTHNICYNNGTAGTAGAQDGIRINGELGTINGADISHNRCFDNQSVTNLTDGAMTSSSVTMTSATAAFTYYDIGKSITVNGAGVAGANLTTTIQNVISATSIKLATAASTTVSGATVAYGHAQTQQNGIAMKALVTNATVAFNDVRGNASAGILPSLTTPSDATVTYINNPGYNPEQTYAQGNVTGATTFNRLNGDVIKATLTGNITTTVSAGKSIGDRLTLALTQDGTGSRTVSKPSNVKLVGGAFSPTATAGATDTYVLRYDGTNWIETSRALNVS